MKAVFTLTSSESRRLIAKAVAQMPEVKEAWKKAYVLLAGGTTNAFIAEELTGNSYVPGLCTVGESTDGLLCVTNPTTRKSFPNVFLKGEAKQLKLDEALNDYHKETVVIKGANCVDPEGFVGIITSGFDGGTIPKIIGPVTSKGLKFIVPVGLIKMIPSVREASKAIAGASHIDISMGADPGLYCIGTATVITEIESIKMMFNCDAHLVCASGIGGNEGAVTLAVDGDEKNIKNLVKYLEENIKGEPPVEGNKGFCDVCTYKFCKYNGLKPEELPAWMKKKGIKR